MPRLVSATLDRVLEHTVFQLRSADEYGEIYRPRGRAALAIALNRTLTERGAKPPWAWSAERCHEFWSTRPRAAEPNVAEPNTPNYYATKPTEIVDFVHSLWSSHVQRSDAVLEVGCNAGPNLERLRQLGYERLSGVEINPVAIDEMRRVFPELARKATIYQGSLEKVLPALPANSADTVLAMAVLHHIHPSSRSVFSEMVRVAARHVLVIEPEQVACHYVFCRDHQRVFERLGCQQLQAVEISQSACPEVASEYHGYTARLFRVLKAADRPAR